MLESSTTWDSAFGPHSKTVFQEEAGINNRLCPFESTFELRALIFQP